MEVISTSLRVITTAGNEIFTVPTGLPETEAAKSKVSFAELATTTVKTRPLESPVEEESIGSAPIGWSITSVELVLLCLESAA